MSKTQEIKFQKKRAGTIRNSKIVDFANKEKYRKRQLSPNIIRELLFLKLGNLKNKKILEIGCGDGENVVLYALLGAQIDALDISPHLLEIARKKTFINHVEKRITFYQTNLELFDFPKKNYDFIISYGVLHHTQFKKYFDKMIDTLKPTGQLILIEPIDLSPTFNKLLNLLFRSKSRQTSPGEKPLGKRDIDFIFSKMKICYQKRFNLIARLTRLIKGDNLPESSKTFTRLIVRFSYWIDNKLYQVYFLRKFFRVIFLTGKNEN